MLARTPDWNLTDDEVLFAIEADTIKKVAPLVLAWYMELAETHVVTPEMQKMAERMTGLVVLALDQYEYPIDIEEIIYPFFGDLMIIPEIISAVGDELGGTDAMIAKETAANGIAAYPTVAKYFGIEDEEDGSSSTNTDTDFGNCGEGPEDGQGSTT